ncbi:Xaa-Pro peptidase family protein [Aquibacillus sp. 3ASR75-11]|uniref:Xaa-Pro peptidase family protein n=1 Tax=Terrihalobacillus insolitus TaxID=2950438 RepID=A0A9X3WSF7_9BACI|nr:Xaa-Pro peptidase family protein [Terrihalobacillus insolitus]MDC3412653.1 Xaa-Pro peptidase family protein [Terrihalobacillus insolitus]MDC3424003.1 Xaa-Pro peptidase family protein [Terrihalobacillus insolitus]
METRINKLLHMLKEKNVDSLFLTSKANIFYLSNYYTEPHERLVAIYLDQKDDPLLILPAMEKQDAVQAGWKGALLPYTDDENPWKLFSNYIKQLKRKPKSLAIEKDHLTVDRYESIKGVLPSTELIEGKELVSDLRLIKDKEEMDTLKHAAKLADYGIKVGVDALQVGKRELDVIAEIEYALKKEGVREMSFSTMVLAGKNTASPHGTPGLNKIKAGDLVLFDLGVVYNGYCSDITRTIAYQEINPEQEKIYQAVLRGQEKAIEAAQLGKTVGTLDQAARHYISAAGYGEYFTHRIGHGIGIDVHEYPSLTSENNLTLQSGMSFTIEPGIYVPNVGGVRIEDEIVMTEEGAELLTTYPKELQVIE